MFKIFIAQFMEEMENAEIRRAKFFGKRTKVSRVLGRMLKSWSSNFDRLNRQLAELSWTEYHPGKLEELLHNAITFDKMLRKIVNKNFQYKNKKVCAICCCNSQVTFIPLVALLTRLSDSIVTCHYVKFVVAHILYCAYIGPGKSVYWTSFKKNKSVSVKCIKCNKMFFFATNRLKLEPVIFNYINLKFTNPLNQSADQNVYNL